MSEYVPTTKEVRDAYVVGMEHDCYYEGDVKLTPDGVYEANRFNAWLAAHDAEVAARQIDAPSVREAIGEVLADMEATAEGTHIASSLALLQEITDAAIRAAVSPPSRTAKRTGYETVGHAVGEHSQTIRATAALTTPQEGDARERLHAKCDCVPDLGPAHCHLCSADGSPVEWANCVAVQQVTDAPETVEVAFKTVEVERLGHLLVQLSPATPSNGAATVRRLMEEMNIKEMWS